MKDKIKIIFVDDELSTTAYFTGELRKLPGVKLVHGVGSGERLMEEAGKNNYDLAILDYNMKPMDGLDVLRFLQQQHPAMKVILHTAIHDHELLKVLLNSGAHGLLYKDFKVYEVTHAMQYVFSNNFYLSQHYTEMIRSVDFPLTRSSTIHAEDKLSPRETEIMIRHIAGLHAKEIGVKLKIETATVESHIKHIHRKTHTDSVYGLMRYCINHNIFSFSFIMNDTVKEKVITHYHGLFVPKNK